ncbi:DNA-binding response regulator [candidate division KSB1 bacterium]|nr:response regulator transcription factor [candidate division KSB1 bacterium]RQW04420.1 MAG: DNA-binding response regulator [candidate division KSB1 bacterium]
MKQKRILIIEDDAAILRGLAGNLIFEGYSVMSSQDGREGLDMALQHEVDLVLLDLLLPSLDGYNICRQIKAAKPELPIIMLTAKSQDIDVVKGLDLGADDYIIKPFSIIELCARIRVQFRNEEKSPIDLERYTFGDVTIDFKKYKANKNGKLIHLSPKEFQIMKYFILHAEEVVHRHDLLHHVWGYEKYPSTRTVDNFILELRKKIEKNPSHPVHIISVHGVGYKFNP